MIATILSALESTLLSIPTLHVYRHPPSAINTAQLPAAVLLHSNSIISQHAVGYVRYLYTVTVLLACAPVAQDITPHRVQQAIATYEAVIDKLVSDFSLGGIADHVTELTDNGLQTITISGVEYLGYEIRVNVVIKR